MTSGQVNGEVRTLFFKHNRVVFDGGAEIMRNITLDQILSARGSFILQAWEAGKWPMRTLHHSFSARRTRHCASWTIRIFGYPFCDHMDEDSMDSEVECQICKSEDQQLKEMAGDVLWECVRKSGPGGRNQRITLEEFAVSMSSEFGTTTTYGNLCINFSPGRTEEEVEEGWRLTAGEVDSGGCRDLYARHLIL